MSQLDMVLEVLELISADHGILWHSEKMRHQSLFNGSGLDLSKSEVGD